MGGGGSAAAMNAVISNNRKLLKKQAKNKLGYSGIYSDIEPKGYSFDDIKYDENAKEKVNHLIAKRKKEDSRRKIIGLILSALLVAIIFWLFKLYNF
jgi:cell division protein FtsB